jgi:hypothetical protein
MVVGFSPCGAFHATNFAFTAVARQAGASLIFIFRNCCRPKARGQVAFSFPGPRGQVFVRGVEVKATFHDSRKVCVYSENALAQAEATLP